MDLIGKNILVAGGTGLVGTSLTKRLHQMGAKVTSSCFSKRPPFLEECYKQFDFTKLEDCLKATKNQEIVYIVAVKASGVKGLSSNPTVNILPNLEIHAALLEACVMNKVKKAVWVSSSTVYQEAFYPITEDQIDWNQQVYSLYQGMGWLYRYIEQLCKHYHDTYELDIGIIRTSSIYGPFDNFDDEKSHVIPALIKRCLQKENPFVVWGSPYTVRDFVYVDDLVEGILRVTENYCVGEPVNISNGKPTSIEELTKLTLELCQHNPEIVHDSTKPSAVPYRVLSNQKFNTICGPLNLTSLKDGLKSTIEWYKSRSH